METYETETRPSVLSDEWLLCGEDENEKFHDFNVIEYLLQLGFKHSEA